MSWSVERQYRGKLSVLTAIIINSYFCFTSVTELFALLYFTYLRFFFTFFLVRGLDRTSFASQKLNETSSVLFTKKSLMSLDYFEVFHVL